MPRRRGGTIFVPPCNPHARASCNRAEEQGRTGHPTMAQLTHAARQDGLRWCCAGVRTPVWQRRLQSPQRLPGRGLATRTSGISQGIRCGNTDESPLLRGRGTVLEAFDLNWKDRRMLSASTGDTCRAMSKVAPKGRRGKDLRSLLNHPDLWMQASRNIQGKKGALTRGTTTTTMDGYAPERAAHRVARMRERRYTSHGQRLSFFERLKVESE